MDEQARLVVTRDLDALRALEDDGAKAISQQIDDARGMNQMDALRAFEVFEKVLDAHVGALDARLSALGAGASSSTGASAPAATGAFCNQFAALRGTPMSTMLRADYGFLSFDAISYLTLHTTALSLGDVETANLVERGYRDCAQLVVEIDRIIPNVVLAELRARGLSAKDITSECRHLVATSWRRQPPVAATRRAM